MKKKEQVFDVFLWTTVYHASRWILQLSLVIIVTVKKEVVWSRITENTFATLKVERDALAYNFKQMMMNDTLKTDASV